MFFCNKNALAVFEKTVGNFCKNRKKQYFCRQKLTYNLCHFIMKKKNFFWLAALALLTVACNHEQSLISTDCSIAAAYCNNNIDGALGANSNGNYTYQGAIELQDTMWVGRGTQIIAIRVGLSAPCTDCKVWIAHSKEGPYIYEQNFTYQGTGWEYVKLNTPYKLVKGEALFVGYSVKSTGKPIAYQKVRSNNPRGNKFAIGNTWYSLNRSEAGLTGLVCVQAMIDGGFYGDRTQYDIKVNLLEYADYVKISENSVIKGIITNYGVHNLTGGKITYTDGFNTKTIDIPRTLANGEPYMFTFENLTPGAANTDRTFTVTGEGGGDADSKSGIQNFYGLAHLRNVLLEQFTSQSCLYCPGGEQNLHDAIGAHVNDVCWIAHHVGFMDDNYTVSDSRPYTWFYGTDGTYAPACMLDRREAGYIGADTKVPVFNSMELTPAILNKAFSVPSFASVNVATQLTGRDLTVTVSGNFLKALPKAKLNVFLIQDSLIGFQKDRGTRVPDYVHMHTVRARLSSQWGDNITLDADSNYTQTYNYAIPDSIMGVTGVKTPVVLNNLSVVAFVADYTAGNRNECTVHNAGKAKLSE